jgi:hypothetical protein
MKARWERCPVPAIPSKVSSRHKETLAWTWENYVIVRCFKKRKSEEDPKAPVQITFAKGFLDKPHPVCARPEDDDPADYWEAMTVEAGPSGAVRPAGPGTGTQSN